MCTIGEATERVVEWLLERGPVPIGASEPYRHFAFKVLSASLTGKYICTLSAAFRLYSALQVDSFELLAVEPRLVDILLNPDSFRVRLVQLLRDTIEPSRFGIPEFGQIWLRLVGVPLPLLPLPLLNLSEAANKPVYVYGVCSSVTSIVQRVYSKNLVCSECGERSEALEPHGPKISACCSAVVEEDITQRQYCPVQLLGFRSFSKSSTVARFRVERELEVEICGDDLCGQFSPGTCAVIFGKAALVRRQPDGSQRIPAEVQIKANNVQVVHPCHVACPMTNTWQKEEWSSTVLRNDACVLSQLCDALTTWLGYPASEDLLCALLISAASQTPARVHVLLQTHGNDSPLLRLLQSTAVLLSPHSMTWGPHEPLLPSMKRIERNESIDSVRITAGQLALAGPGMFVLNADLLQKAEKGQLAEAIRKGTWTCPTQPELSFPYNAAIWATSTKASDQNGYFKRTAKNVTSSFEDHIDLVIDSTREGHVEDTVDVPFLDIPAEMSCEERTMQENLGLAFRSHMSEAAEREPVLSRDAEYLMQHYFLSRRPLGEGVGGTTLSSMARIAKASASLHLRDLVQPFPDAVLAIYMMEQSIIAKGGSPCLFESLDHRNGGPESRKPLGERLSEIYKSLHQTFRHHIEE